VSRYDWMDEALCAQVDADLWFPDTGQTYHAAKRICAACPVQQQCGEQAQTVERGLSHPYRHGAWAGVTPRTRAKQSEHTAAELRDAEILRLAAAGWDAEAIADHVGCTSRTVWRVLEAHRNQIGEAA